MLGRVHQPSRDGPNVKLIDRLACAFLGLVSGAIYGTVLAIVVGFLTTGQIHALYVWCTSGVFATIGFVWGPKVGDVIVGTIHLVYGLAAGFFSGAAGTSIDPEPQASGVWRTLFIFGLGTGFAAFLAWFLSR
jgi:hypothetical protein